MTMNVDEEIEKLMVEIARLGKVQPDGSISLKFGTLFNDERCANLFEALLGTLRAAKKRKLLKFEGELLLQGVHDNVDVILLKSTVLTSDKPDVSKPELNCVVSKPVVSKPELNRVVSKPELKPVVSKPDLKPTLRI